jgi:murein DD-endopeptidase MepM/ murein hydrolase activator NlpD
VADAPISQPFGRPNPRYAAGYHTGVDFAVPVGTPVLAVARATVRVAGPGGEYGKEIKLILPDGKIALYAHLSRIGVHPGEQVAPGERLGASGDTGNSTGPHLHFEIRTTDAYGAVIDPLPYLLAHGAPVATVP